MCDEMAPQHEADHEPENEDWRRPGSRVLRAMQMGAAMHEAQMELEREPIGVELARRAGAAARAAVLELTDWAHPGSPGMFGHVTQSVALQAYCGEWNRLMATDRAEWHK